MNKDLENLTNSQKQKITYLEIELKKFKGDD